MPVIAIALIMIGLAGLILWGTRSNPNERRGPGFDVITGAGGAGDFMDPERGIIGPDEADIERFGGA
jgi:hypothetical protein